MEEQVNNQLKGNAGKTCGSDSVAEEDRNKPTYCVTDVPPWYLCIFLALQVGLICDVISGQFCVFNLSNMAEAMCGCHWNCVTSATAFIIVAI